MTQDLQFATCPCQLLWFLQHAVQGTAHGPLWKTTDILFITGKMVVQASLLRRGAAFSGKHRAFFQVFLCSHTPVPFLSELCLLISKVGPWIKSLISSSITRFTSRFQTVPLLVHEMLLFFPREWRWSNRKPSRLVSIYSTFASNF